MTAGVLSTVLSSRVITMKIFWWGIAGDRKGDVSRILPFVFWLKLGTLYYNNYQEF